jgi:iron complex transport system permease protein
LLCGVLVCALAAAFILCICVGKYPVSPGDTLKILFGAGGGEAGAGEMETNVILGLRVPRILAAIICGAALSVSGAAYQGVFKNPLVSPDFLGVSQGACVGAAAAILLHLGSGAMQIFAFAGGLIAVALTLLIPMAMRSDSNIMLVLAGIIVGGVMASILGLLKYIADPETELAAITYWQLGSFQYVTIGQLLSVLPAILIALILLLLLSWRIDLLAQGEAEAKALGANVILIRTLTVVCSTLLTAGAVCMAGTIGWVGLVIPHFARMLTGSANTRLLPAACLIGALFMVLVDTMTRIIGTTEVPISILTGLVGAPFYAWLLYRNRRTLR